MDRIVKFGPQGRLVGVLSGAALPPDAPVLVLPSAGLLPRYGPFRLHIELARILLPCGIRTFRFEVPGVGETARLPGVGAVEATLAALDQLSAECGARRFVVGGVCSAADVGWSAALADERVAGVLLLDGLGYTGPWFHAARVAGVLRRPPREWWQVLQRWLGRVRGDAARRDMADYRDWPERSEAQRQFAALTARNVRSLWIYTGGYRDRFLHPRQFAWSFGRATRHPSVAMHYWPDCDHTFYARVHRDRLLATVRAWLTAGFAQPGAAS
jgi:hypothetical protein